MATKKIIDTRDEILDHLKEIERPLTWLSRVTDIPYPTIYSIFKQRLIRLSQNNLDKINDGLNTLFLLPKDVVRK